ncbi:MAG TPA: hypothetical protein VHZ76_06935 [Gammaproteobacteria bacterium]|nr:hypothetical protein [Gammaproteobacteria bacterium]
MKTLKMQLIILTLAFCITGCTTAMYFDPSLVDAQKHQYEFYIKTGGFSGPDTADQRAMQEINKFMVANGYSKFKIIHRIYKFIPSGFDYLVEFSK